MYIYIYIDVRSYSVNVLINLVFPRTINMLYINTKCYNYCTVTSLKFLGIVIDMVRMEARLPTDKLEKIRCLVAKWLPKTNATKRNILSLVGLLQHAAKVVHPGRIFVRYMYNVAARVQELDYYARLDKEFKTDLCWWHTFLGERNGASLLQMAGYPLPPQYTIQTDASGTWGCGAYSQGRWLQWQWPQEWLPSTIMAKELVPIMLSCAVWGPLLNRKTVSFQCNNRCSCCSSKGISQRGNSILFVTGAVVFHCSVQYKP